LRRIDNIHGVNHLTVSGSATSAAILVLIHVVFIVEQDAFILLFHHLLIAIDYRRRRGRGGIHDGVATSSHLASRRWKHRWGVIRCWADLTMARTQVPRRTASSASNITGCTTGSIRCSWGCSAIFRRYGACWAPDVDPGQKEFFHRGQRCERLHQHDVGAVVTQAFVCGIFAQAQLERTRESGQASGSNARAAVSARVSVPRQERRQRQALAHRERFKQLVHEAARSGRTGVTAVHQDAEPRGAQRCASSIAAASRAACCWLHGEVGEDRGGDAALKELKSADSAICRQGCQELRQRLGALGFGSAVILTSSAAICQRVECGTQRLEAGEIITTAEASTSSAAAAGTAAKTQCRRVASAHICCERDDFS
jgi:hypothetical protein